MFTWPREPHRRKLECRIRRLSDIIIGGGYTGYCIVAIGVQFIASDS